MGIIKKDSLVEKGYVNKVRPKLIRLAERAKKIVLNDRTALIVIAAVFLFLVLPVFVKPLGYVPALRFYFEGLGEYYASYYSPHRVHTFFSEIDSMGYYAYMPSVLIDHDLDFDNQLGRVNWKWTRSETGRIINVWSVGPAVMWAPFFILGHIFSVLLNLVGFKVPLNGYSLFYELPCYFATVFYGFLAVLLTYRFCREFFEEKSSLIATLVTLFATPLVFYVEFEPSMSHVMAYLTATACIYVYHRNLQERSAAKWAAVGLLGGLTALIRWQCASLVFFILLVDFIFVARTSFRSNYPKLFFKNLLMWAMCALIVLVVFIPQVVAWFGFLGKIDGMSEIPQMGRGIEKYLAPALIETLFHYYHGIISWTPIVVPALVGFYLFSRRRFSQTVVIIWLFFLSQIYFIASSDWTSGWSFGQRRLIETFIIIALGLGEILHSFRNNRTAYLVCIAIGLFFVWWNSVFIYQWIFKYMPAGGFANSVAQLTYDKFWVFPRMLRRALVPLTGLFNIW